MTTLPSATTSESYRRAGWAAIASGVIGIIAIASLIAYLTTQASEFLESGVMPPVGRLLLTSNYVGVMLQALFMIPVALALHALGRQRSPGVSRAAVTVGIIALCGVAFLRLLLLVSPEVSDILFMGPMGFVGVWPIVVNWLLAGVLSKALRIAGKAAPNVIIAALTLPEHNASTTILRKLGFRFFGTTKDPDAGAVWEWRA